MKILLVGGPADGRREFRPRNDMMLRVPVVPDMKILAAAHVDPNDDPVMTVEDYRIEKLRGENHTFEFGVSVRMRVDEALELLFKNYVGKENRPGDKE